MPLDPPARDDVAAGQALLARLHRELDAHAERILRAAAYANSFNVEMTLRLDVNQDRDRVDLRVLFTDRGDSVKAGR